MNANEWKQKSRGNKHAEKKIINVFQEIKIFIFISFTTQILKCFLFHLCEHWEWEKADKQEDVRCDKNKKFRLFVYFLQERTKHNCVFTENLECFVMCDNKKKIR